MDFEKLKNIQKNDCSEFYAQQIFASHGFKISSSDVNNRKFDFIAEAPTNNVFEIKVLKLHDLRNVFVAEKRIVITPKTLLFILSGSGGQMSDGYLIPFSELKRQNLLLPIDNCLGEYVLNLPSDALPKLKKYTVESFMKKYI